LWRVIRWLTNFAAMLALGHSLPIHSAPVPTFARYAPKATEFFGAAK
jgi:hypothetical protein